MAAEHPYNELYYLTGLGQPYERNAEWLDFFQKLADRILADLQPASVLDAGCAFGFLVEGLRNRGAEAWGVDISAYAISQAAPEVAPFCRVHSISSPFERQYDLIVTIEVLEHLPWDQAQAAIANLCQHCQRILFSSTPEDFKELTHITVRPPEVWAEVMARNGFFRDLDYDASYLTPWAALFTRAGLTPPRLVRAYERRFYEVWKENNVLRKTVLEHQEMPGQMYLLQEDNKALRRDLDLIHASPTWRTVEGLGRVFSAQNPLRRFLRRLFRRG